MSIKMEYIYIDNISYDLSENIFELSLKKYLNKLILINDEMGIKYHKYIIKSILQEHNSVEFVNENNKYNIIQYVDYHNKLMPFCIGIYNLSNTNIIITILDKIYKLNKYDIIWFPLCWTIPFKEEIDKYNNDNINTLKIIVYSDI